VQDDPRAVQSLEKRFDALTRDVAELKRILEEMRSSQ
jgi:hypothetical protein